MCLVGAVVAVLLFLFPPMFLANLFEFVGPMGESLGTTWGNIGIGALIWFSILGIIFAFIAAWSSGSSTSRGGDRSKSRASTASTSHGSSTFGGGGSSKSLRELRREDALWKARHLAERIEEAQVDADAAKARFIEKDRLAERSGRKSLFGLWWDTEEQVDADRARDEAESKAREIGKMKGERDAALAELLLDDEDD